MEIEQLPLGGALLVTPRIFADERGYFEETYSLDRYRRRGIEETFVQDNLSLSRRDVLRGLHADLQMAKLVYVVRGSVYDAIVDIRPSSPTYRRSFSVTLTASAGRQLYVPPGFLHGFLALEDETIVGYKQSAPYRPDSEISVAWDDPELAIEWPLGGRRPILSPRDAVSPALAAAAVTNSG
jgi:dTDP-4-dehydrorhamnose 3,5-epimerase